MQKIKGEGKVQSKNGIYIFLLNLQTRKDVVCISPRDIKSLVEESEDLATSVAGAGLLVVHDAEGGRQDNEAELAGGQDGADPLLESLAADVEAGADGTALVQAAVEVDDDLAGAVVVDDLELANVTVLLHDLQELDDDLGARAEEDLALAAALGASDGAEGVSQNGHKGHFSGRLAHCAETIKRNEMMDAVTKQNTDIG
jgi:hypothetical protein